MDEHIRENKHSSLLDQYRSVFWIQEKLPKEVRTQILKCMVKPNPYTRYRKVENRKRTGRKTDVDRNEVCAKEKN